MHRLLTYFVVDIRAKRQASVPKIELSVQHLANAKLLSSRFEMLHSLPKGGICAELGVNKGDFSEQIMEITRPEKLVLIDFFDDKDKKSMVCSRLAASIKSKTVELYAGNSLEMAARFTDGYFDWVYIDTDHSYSTTKSELELYRTKVKPGGIIAGHDYIQGSWPSLVRYGVQEAVHEFCQKYGWEFLYVTMELNDHPSFAIRRIG